MRKQNFHLLISIIAILLIFLIIILALSRNSGVSSDNSIINDSSSINNSSLNNTIDNNSSFESNNTNNSKASKFFISSISFSSGMVGDKILIKGHGFNFSYVINLGNNKVTPISYYNLNNQDNLEFLVPLVPFGTYNLDVRDNEEILKTNDVTFDVINCTTNLSSITPLSGPVNTRITIEGRFGYNNNVYINPGDTLENIHSSDGKNISFNFPSIEHSNANCTQPGCQPGGRFYYQPGIYSIRLSGTEVNSCLSNILFFNITSN